MTDQRPTYDQPTSGLIHTHDCHSQTFHIFFHWQNFVIQMGSCCEHYHTEYTPPLWSTLQWFQF